VPVELPPPPRVIERLLPEIQAALDDRVRQDDLEAELYGDSDDDGGDDGGDDAGDDAGDAWRSRARHTAGRPAGERR